MIDAVLLFFKTFFGGGKLKMTLKGLAILIVLAGASYGMWKFYHFAQERQATKDQVVIDQLNKQVASLKADLNTETASVKDWQQRTAAAQSKFDTLQKTTVTNLQNKLADANQRAAAWQKKAQTPKEIIRYVTAKDDSRCTIGTGFIQLYNNSIEAPDSSQYAVGVLSSGSGVGFDAPTSLRLSQFASLLVYNNAEAVRRGAVIHIWQNWYVQTKANWNTMMQQIAQGVPPETALKSFSLNDPTLPSSIAPSSKP